MAKDTTRIVEELHLFEDFSTFYNENKTYMISESLSEMLLRLLKEKQLRKADVIRDAELSEVYGYQIFSGLRVPERKKLLALSLGMHLSLDETQTLLKSAGYSPLYVKRPFDSIVLFGICKRMSVVDVNELLYAYDLETLG